MLICCVLTGMESLSDKQSMLAVCLYWGLFQHFPVDTSLVFKVLGPFKEEFVDLKLQISVVQNKSRASWKQLLEMQSC